MGGELEKITRFTHLHNEYLTTLAGSGIFGLISLMVVLLTSCIWIFRHAVDPLLRGKIVTLCTLYATYGLTNLSI